MGWLALLVVGAGAMVLLAATGFPRALWSFAGAALMLGAAGYAWQGSPNLPGAAPDQAAKARADDPELIALRDQMFGRFTLDSAYLTAADAMATSGDDRSAVRVLLGGLNKLPGSYVLWTALGSAYAKHDAGLVSPASAFAFARARRLAPRQPAPPFFEGLAYARAGDLPRARTFWLQALRLTPTGRSYRRDIALRLALIDRLIAMQAGARQR